MLPSVLAVKVKDQGQMWPGLFDLYCLQNDPGCVEWNYYN